MWSPTSSLMCGIGRPDFRCRRIVLAGSRTPGWHKRAAPAALGGAQLVVYVVGGRRHRWCEGGSLNPSGNRLAVQLTLEGAAPTEPQCPGIPAHAEAAVRKWSGPGGGTSDRFATSARGDRFRAGRR